MLIAKKPLLGVNISVTNYQRVVEAVMDASVRARPLSFTALDAHGLRRAAKDPQFRDLVNSFDIVSPDGHSLRWGLNALHGERLPDRVAGPDLTLHLCASAAARGYPIFLYGSHAHVLAGLSRKLLHLFPALKIAGTQPSRFRAASDEEDAQDLELIRRSGASLAFIGLGCPLQEQWVAAHTARLSLPLLAVGAAFDFISGNKRRAPKWMQDRGLEWIFRIAVEPRRLVRRSMPAVTFVFFALLGHKVLRSRTARRQEKAVSSISFRT
jgi:exopolysaccharide biosynthesis WecB/TagA/CpsF family protein